MGIKEKSKTDEIRDTVGVEDRNYYLAFIGD